MALRKRIPHTHNVREPLDHTLEDLVNFLYKRHIPFPRKSSKKILANIVRAADIGQPRYQTLPIDTFHAFLRQHGISYDGPLENNALSARLRRADEERGFPQVLDLPQELREAIYGLAMMDPWGDVNAYPVQPAATRVSRQIRREAPEVFYSRMTFAISLHGRLRDLLKSGEHFGSPLWLQHLSPQYLGMIRYLKVDPQGQHYSISWLIHFECRTGALVGTEFSIDGDYGAAPGLDAFQAFRIIPKNDDLERGFRCILQKLAAGNMIHWDYQHFAMWIASHPRQLIWKSGL